MRSLKLTREMLDHDKVFKKTDKTKDNEAACKTNTMCFYIVSLAILITDAQGQTF